MAKQTFTTGQVLTAAQMTSLQQTAMLGGDANARTASYVLVAGDAGNAVSMNSSSPTTITVNNSIFAAGDIVTIINLGTGVCTITAGTATVATSGSLALAQNQGGVLRFTSASAAIFFQFATPASGDIEGVTAGTGISGGGTSGTVTITNSMATAIDAKGDLIVGTGADTFDRLAVGTNGHTLVADSSTATGLKWATVSGGGLTLLSTTTLSGTTTTISSISQDYQHLFWVLYEVTMSANAAVAVQPNNNNQAYSSGTRGNHGTTSTQNYQNFGELYVTGTDNLLSTDGLGVWAGNFYNYTATTYRKPFDFVGGFQNSSSQVCSLDGHGLFNSESAITSITLKNSATTSFTAGTFLLYGVK